MAQVLVALVIIIVGVSQPSGSTVVVSRETEPRRFSEPHLVLHPARPSHFLAAVWTGSTSESQLQDRRCSSIVSTDKGLTWQRHDFAIAECYDAQVAIVPDGHAVFVALGRMPNIQPQRPDWLFVFRSDNGGVTWDDEPTVIGPRYDHPAVAVDLSRSSRRGWIYVTSHLEWADGSALRKSAVMLTRSRDAGQTFDVPVFLSPNELHNSSEMPVVLPDGTLLIAYQEYPWISPTPRRLWAVRSSDGGVTFSPPHLVSESCGPPPAMQLTSFAADSTTLRVYAACRQSNGGPAIVSSSTDRGDTWSRGVAAGPSTHDTVARRVMSIAVDSSGLVGAMVVERRGADGAGCHNVTLAISRDGGTTFEAPLTVSTTPSGESPNDLRARQRFPTYGDYYGIVSTDPGRFQLMWPEMRDGSSVLVTTAVDVRR